MSDLTRLVRVPGNVNRDLEGTSNALMLSLLGNPRGNYTADCQPVTNAAIKARMKTASVGPFRVTGFDLAVDSLKEVMTDIAAEQRAVHDALSTAGMLCCRLVRGSNHSISNHSWGTAVDLKIEGVLDTRGDDKVQHGLTLIAPIFNRHDWFWGATFRTEDGMHFEISKQKLGQWQRDGKLLGSPAPTTTIKIVFGERSERVVELQGRLNKLGERLDVDGIFGASTHAAVIAFQGLNGLSADGIVGRNSWTKLVEMTGG